MTYLIYPSVSLPKSAHLLLPALKSLTVLSLRVQGELKLQYGEQTKSPGVSACGHVSMSFPITSGLPRDLGSPVPCCGEKEKPPAPLSSAVASSVYSSRSCAWGSHCSGSAGAIHNLLLAFMYLFSELPHSGGNSGWCFASHGVSHRRPQWHGMCGTRPSALC